MGVLTANILWKIPQRQHTAVDIGWCIAAVHVVISAGKYHSRSFPLISHTQVYDRGPRVVVSLSINLSVISMNPMIQLIVLSEHFQKILKKCLSQIESNLMRFLALSD